MLSIVIFFASVVAWFHLPVARYPRRSTPPQHQRHVPSYAERQQLRTCPADPVAAPIEQQINWPLKSMMLHGVAVEQQARVIVYKVCASGRASNLNFAQVLGADRINLAGTVPARRDPSGPEVMRAAAIPTCRHRHRHLFAQGTPTIKPYLKASFVGIALKDEIARVDGGRTAASSSEQQDYSMLRNLGRSGRYSDIALDLYAATWPTPCASRISLRGG